MEFGVHGSYQPFCIPVLRSSQRIWPLDRPYSDFAPVSEVNYSDPRQEPSLPYRESLNVTPWNRQCASDIHDPDPGRLDIHSGKAGPEQPDDRRKDDQSDQRSPGPCVAEGDEVDRKDNTEHYEARSDQASDQCLATCAVDAR